MWLNHACMQAPVDACQNVGTCGCMHLCVVCMRRRELPMAPVCDLQGVLDTSIQVWALCPPTWSYFSEELSGVVKCRSTSNSFQGHGTSMGGEVVFLTCSAVLGGHLSRSELPKFVIAYGSDQVEATFKTRRSIIGSRLRASDRPWELWDHLFLPEASSAGLPVYLGTMPSRLLTNPGQASPGQCFDQRRNAGFWARQPLET